MRHEEPHRILVIDDEPAIRNLLTLTLGGDYECAAVGSAAEALELLPREEFSLVISDIRMDGMSGLEMVPRVKALAPDTVIVMVSGEGGIGSAIEAMRVGAFDYVTKPFDLSHVEAAVARALEHHALLVTKRRYECHLEETVKRRTSELNYLTNHDALTGLPNQRLFKERLADELARAGGCELTVMSLSLDRFKKVNDTLGYAGADRLLQLVAARLKMSVREDDMVARWDGDEFALLIACTRVAAFGAARGVLRAFEQPFELGGQEVFLTASVGISTFPDDGDDPQTLLKNAGAALYSVKREGGSSYQFYTRAMNERALELLALESSLRRGIEREEFVVYYQPQVESSTRRVVGVEALARWQHPTLGMVSPADFIPLAEDTGLIVPLGEQVLRAACAQAAAWQEEGAATLRMAVNLSPRQFREHDLLKMVSSALGVTGLDPRRLGLEVTEGAAMQDAESAIRTLGRLDALGVSVFIDDFGTGYSSLNYLKRLPIKGLKVDRSFVKEMAADPKDGAIVRATVALAKSLGLKVTAEGVETEEQFELLRQMRCDEVQGYLFGPPLPAEVFTQTLLEHGGRDGARLRTYA